MTGRYVVATCVAASLLCSARASAANKLIAVLPLDVRMTQGTMSPAARASFEDMLRDVAVNQLASSGWTVLTGETTLQVLTDNGVDAAHCGNDECHLTIAREIDVGTFISGAIQLADNEYTASIRLVDTLSGRVLSAEQLTGATVPALRDSFAPKSHAFFVRAGLLSPDSPAFPDTTSAFDDNGVHVPGEEMFEKGGHVQVPVRQQVLHPRYEDQSAIARVLHNSQAHLTPGSVDIQDDDAPQPPAAGYLDVSATPSQATITVDGHPASAGRLGPLAAGPHVIRAQASGFNPVEETVNVTSHEVAATHLILPAASAQLMLSTNVETDCEAQGSRVHVAPDSDQTMNLPAGQIELQCRRDGYQPFSRQVTLDPGEMVFVPVVLSPISPPPVASGAFDPSKMDSVLVIEPKSEHRVLVEVADSRPAQVTPSDNGGDGVWVLKRHTPGPAICDGDDGSCSGDPGTGSIGTGSIGTGAPGTGSIGTDRTGPGTFSIQVHGSPSTVVDVGPFQIDRRPISVKAYARCVEAGACSAPRSGGACRWDAGEDDLPVNCVDWYQARQYCQWTGGRLPSADEWEYAATGQMSGVSSDAFAPTSATFQAASVWEWTSTTLGTRMVLGRLLPNDGDPIASHRFSPPAYQEDTVGFRCRL